MIFIETKRQRRLLIMKHAKRQALIGYALARSHSGNGDAFEAVSALLDFLFTGLDLQRVVAECDVGNIAS